MYFKPFKLVSKKRDFNFILLLGPKINSEQCNLKKSYCFYVLNHLNNSQVRFIITVKPFFQFHGLKDTLTAGSIITQVKAHISFLSLHIFWQWKNLFRLYFCRKVNKNFHKIIENIRFSSVCVNITTLIGTCANMLWEGWKWYNTMKQIV